MPFQIVINMFVRRNKQVEYFIYITMVYKLLTHHTTFFRKLLALSFMLGNEKMIYFLLNYYEIIIKKKKNCKILIFVNRIYST